MTNTVQQNKAHRTSTTWLKTPGKNFRVAGELYLSEYVNVFTGQAIRKSWRMTGADWHLFDADGTRQDFGHSTLTMAKVAAETN